MYGGGIFSNRLPDDEETKTVNRRHPLHEVIVSTVALVAVVGFLAMIILAG